MVATLRTHFVLIRDTNTPYNHRTRYPSSYTYHYSFLSSGLTVHFRTRIFAATHVVVNLQNVPDRDPYILREPRVVTQM